MGPRAHGLRGLVASLAAVGPAPIRGIVPLLSPPKTALDALQPARQNTATHRTYNPVSAILCWGWTGCQLRATRARLLWRFRTTTTASGSGLRRWRPSGLRQGR